MAGEQLSTSKLAKRTGEFRARPEGAIAALAEKTAGILRALFPFLSPGQFQESAQFAKEGRPIPLAKLKAVHPKTGQVLLQRVIDAKLKPYFDSPMSRVPEGWLYTGFKLIRPEEGPAVQAEEYSAPSPETGEEALEISAQIVQAAQLHDPARAPTVVEKAIRQLNQALVHLNSRREPIYLSEEALELRPRFRQYVIACRNIPELSRLRASFVGRAIHTSLPAWRAQVEKIIAKAHFSCLIDAHPQGGLRCIEGTIGACLEPQSRGLVPGREESVKVRHRIKWLAGLVALVLANTVAARAAEPSRVLQAMKDELTRSLRILQSQPTPPYFLSYEITQDHVVTVTGSFGKIVVSNEDRQRQLDIDLRVGDYSLDNTHSIRGGFPGLTFSDRFSMIPVPIEDDPDALRSILWYYTDAKYKRAVEQMTAVKTNVQVKVAQEDKSGDFSREAPEKFVEPAVPLRADRRVWEDKIRKYTAPFARYGDIYDAQAVFLGDVETRWLISSEGTETHVSQAYYRLTISAFTKADDGMELPRHESFFAFTPEGLPDDATVLRAVEKMIKDLHALKKAPIVEPYTGPAILSGRASAVFFHEVMGHRIEGHRQKEEEEGQTFKKKLNEQILPAAFSVYSDPTLRRIGQTDLAGAYRYDNEGVPARRVTVVENGILKNFLMSRTPIEGFEQSNGHGRKQQGFATVARQSNLIVEVARNVSSAGLKKMLLAAIRKENKPFGLYFEDIQGGFTITQRTIPNAFNVLPIMVYRIFPDGREELVRGVDLIGTPLIALSKIVAGDSRTEVFNGVCGAESGGVPVAAASPAILISQIEVQKKEKSQERPPILPAPFEVAQ